MSTLGPSAGATREDKPSDIDRAIQKAADRAEDFARLAPQKKAELLDRIAEGLVKTAADTVALGCDAKGIARGSSTEAEEWFGGPVITVGLARYHAASMRDIAARGRPRLGWLSVHRGWEGRTITRLGPRFPGGGVVESGMRFEVLHQRDVRPNDVHNGQETLASALRGSGEPGTMAILGAGNVSSIPVADVIHALFVENRTAVLKMNPVNAYLRAPFEVALAPLIEPGYLQIIDGGAEAGAHLAGHKSITHIHLTGSAQTHDRIVWGPPGPDQNTRREQNKPVVDKPVTSELGNISPIILAPYLYSLGEIRAIAENIATQLTNNASFNCNAGKVLVIPRCYPQRKLLLDTLVSILEKVPPRKAYYPGAKDRHTELTSGRKGLVHVGSPEPGELPWTLIPEVDPDAEGETLFSTEPFCSLLSVVELGSTDPSDFLDRAVSFCNERLWGSLSACLIVPPLYQDDGDIEHSINRALSNLEYGAVGVNVWPAVIYAAARAPWGGHPKGTLADVQSGIGFVHNPMFLPKIEKSIVTAPLVPIPKPPFIAGHKHALAAAKSLAAFTDQPGIGAALALAKTTLLG